MSRLDRRAFRVWLREQPPESSVGFTWSETDCPLARYLGPGWRVDGLTAKAPGQWHRLPEWARAFAYGVDDLINVPGCLQAVTPPEALAVLDAVEADIGLDEALAHAH
jgi:hypothetical protein